MSRVIKVREILGAREAKVANLLNVATDDVGGITERGVNIEDWERSRPYITTALGASSAVLFAWGINEPNGPARLWHRCQAAWVRQCATMLGLRIWTVGGEPRHPSRWQRYTSRHHPDLEFSEALAASLTSE